MRILQTQGTRSIMLRSSLILICLLLLVVFPVSPIGGTVELQDGNDATAYNAKGLQLYRSGKYKDAVEYYKQAIRVRPDYVEAHLNLADAFFQLKEFKKAIEECKQVIRYSPASVEAYNNMGTAYYAIGEQRKAIEAYKQAIRLNPKSSLTYYNLAATYLKLNNQEAALEQYKILKTIDPLVADKLFSLIYPPMAKTFDGNRVTLSVIATDSQGVPFGDLKQEDFQIFEDDIVQTISTFSSSEVPLVYALTIDTSRSIATSIEQIIDVSKRLIQNNRANDETLLVSFISSGKIETVENFTSDRNALNAGLDGLWIDVGESAILDAVYLSAEAVAQYKANGSYLRRAVIIITDGDERTSYYTLEDVLNLLRKVDVQVFVISLKMKSKKSLRLNENLAKGAVSLLTNFTNETGGRAFFPQSTSELGTVISQVMSLMRTQYVIGYKPVRSVVHETYRHIKVKVVERPGRDKLSVLSRSGYITSTK